MTIAQISTATKTMTFEQANSFITTCGLSLELIRDMSCERLWRVVNLPGIGYISNSYKSLVTGMSDVRFIQNA